MDKMIYVNDVYIPFLKEERMTQIYYGGSSSGKSFFLAQRVVMDNLNGVNWLLTRNIGKTIRNSLFNEIKRLFQHTVLVIFIQSISQIW